ncbi:salicylate synthase [Nocardia sp. NBC_01329]|uniref:salicylate synthase n=1 Tax=Nocardia sp. NBC_01329 TaxID=2903594 RepID=UPI002E1331E3|nr:salicylate synthase [Nocardia sp. NBC_01329]
MSTTDERLRAEYVTDPAAAMSRLAAEDHFGDYVVYERGGEWVFAADPIGTVELDADELRITWAAETTARRWAGSPAQVMNTVLAELPMTGRNAYGWIGFEFCAWSLGATEHLRPGTPLVHLMVPRVEVRIDTSGALWITGAGSEEAAALAATVARSQDSALPQPYPVDVRIDRSGYRERVAEAVAEINAGRYQKVILSRKVELPFAVDIPATYRLGRANNTPARSFLLSLGGLEAAGFSPELVLSVDDDRMVSTEPLAGTRAFGQGAEMDSAARADLITDPKEIVEHALSVQTCFAEIGTVAEPGTASVSDFMAVRERGSVQHLASTVRGRLAAGRTAWDALDAIFPSVTASGIPKRPGVDSVFRHDRPRGLYSGAVLMVSPTGALEAALVLRAVYQTEEGAWLRAGAGVVAQSHPDREFEETCEKLGSVAPYVVQA